MLQCAGFPIAQAGAQVFDRKMATAKRSHHGYFCPIDRPTNAPRLAATRWQETLMEARGPARYLDLIK
jgi:hypothetical protein